MSDTPQLPPQASLEALEAAAFKRLSQMNEGSPTKPSDEALRIAAGIMARKAHKPAGPDRGPTSDKTD